MDIAEINKIDFSSPDAIIHVERLINGLGKTFTIVKTLHPGNYIIRARPNSSMAEEFTSQASLSYAPIDRCVEYKRASIPGSTMFYGSILPETLSITDFPSARITVLTEVSSLLRNRIEIGSEKITFSRWDVIDDIRLFMLPPLKPFDNSSYKEVYSEYEKQLDCQPKEIAENTKKVNRILTNEFTKEDICSHKEYMISAHFTDLVINQFKLDGIFYPSVRSQSFGYCVALTPITVDRKLKLVACGENILIKHGKEMRLDNLSESLDVYESPDSFTYTPIKLNK